MMQLRPSDLATLLESAIANRQNVCVHGPPGIGKTSIIGQVAAKLNYHAINQSVPTLLPEDARIPDMTLAGDTFGFKYADWLPKQGCGPTVLVLDEFSRGMGGVMNMLLSLCGPERRMGSYVLPDCVSIVAAMNPDGGGTGKLSEAMADRFEHIGIAPDARHDDWQRWAAKNGMPVELIAFARAYPEAMYGTMVCGNCAYPTQGTCSQCGGRGVPPKGLIVPTYRSWARVGEVVKLKLPMNIERARVQGNVGEGCAITYLAFAEQFRRLTAVSIDALLMSPDTYPVPDAQEHGTRFAIASALSRRADVGNLGRVLRYLDRMPAEFAVYAVKDAVDRAPELASCPEYVMWKVAHPDV